MPFQARFVLGSWTQPFNEWTSAFLWGTDILFVLLIIFNFQFSISKKDLLLFAFLAIAAISISQALIPAVSWYRFAKLLEYILLFFFVRQQKLSPLVYKAVVASALLQSLIAIVQYVVQHDLGLRLLGESVLDPHGQGVAVVAANSQTYLRAYGTTPHPNILATWLMLGIWALWAWRPKWHLFVLPVLLVSLFLTFSRTAIAVWVLCSMIMWFFHRRDPLKIIAVTAVVGFLFAISFWPQVYSRLHISSSDEAVSQRVFYNDIAGKNILTVGNGIGQFVPNLMQKLPLYPDFIYQPAHNMFLLMMNEIGILGLATFLLWLFVAVRKSHVLLAIILLAVFDHYFWTLQQGGLIMWGLLGFFVRDRIQEPTYEQENPSIS
ncbi:MAG: O-antigen ligase family protein [Patescibacteria group bacterium]